MNAQDQKELTEIWLNEKIDEHFKGALDHAYTLGLKRGLTMSSLTDEGIMELAQFLGEFMSGDAQGDKRREFARAILTQGDKRREFARAILAAARAK